jgi:two-component system sensor histidine kinase QseC
MRWAFWRQSSLQWRLTVSLVLATSLVWCAVLVLTWHETEHELSELLDAHLAQTASVLAAHTGDGHQVDFTTAPVLHKYQPSVAFQIWHDKALISHSANAPTLPLTSSGHAGISDYLHQGQWWRLFATPGHEPDVWVVVAERHAFREDVLKAGLYSALGPVLLGLPVLALLIWWMILQALAPLRVLSQSVSLRHPQALQPIELSGVAAEVQPLVHALNRLFEKIAQQLDKERQFNADAAHELRTPIAAIRIHAQVAQGSRSVQDAQVALNAILQGCDRATRLVAQLLQMSRLDSPANLEETEVAEAVAETRETLAALAPQAMARQQTLDLRGPDTLHLPMAAGLVAVLVGNLVDNAQRYSPAGAQIHVTWQVDPTPCLIVQDDGPGMSEADLTRLGDRFFRVPGSAAQGSGLGWSIVRRLAQRYRLRIKVENRVDHRGLCVSVRWPKSS